MTDWIQWIGILGGAVVVTVLVIRLVPRVRHAALFDRILWLATFGVTCAGSWIALAFVSGQSHEQVLNGVVFANLSFIPMLLGALAGALVINLPLWMMDRWGGAASDKEPDPEDDLN